MNKIKEHLFKVSNLKKRKKGKGSQKISKYVWRHLRMIFNDKSIYGTPNWKGRICLFGRAKLLLTLPNLRSPSLTSHLKSHVLEKFGILIFAMQPTWFGTQTQPAQYHMKIFTTTYNRANIIAFYVTFGKLDLKKLTQSIWTCKEWHCLFRHDQTKDCYLDVRCCFNLLLISL